MIEESTLKFLKGLKKNNRKEWFDANRKDYQKARENFLELVAELIKGMSEFDERVAASNLDPKKTIMRINRDIRFSKDKTPYNSHFFTFINPEGKKSPFGGYYVRIDADTESFHGGGIYMPEGPNLAKIRQEIDYNFKEWTDLVNDQAFKKHYKELKASGKLKRPPKGYDAENEAIEWLKYKGFYTQGTLSEKDVLGPRLVNKLLTSYRSVNPIVNFINRSLED